LKKARWSSSGNLTGTARAEKAIGELKRPDAPLPLKTGLITPHVADTEIK
jgi:hypothetical protein